MPLEYPLWPRATHFFNFLFLSLLVRSGLEILSAHPRLYWNDHCTPGSEWLKVTKKRRPTDRLSSTSFRAWKETIRSTSWSLTRGDGRESRSISGPASKCPSRRPKWSVKSPEATAHFFAGHDTTNQYIWHDSPLVHPRQGFSSRSASPGRVSVRLVSVERAAPPMAMGDLGGRKGPISPAGQPALSSRVRH